MAVWLSFIGLAGCPEKPRRKNSLRLAGQAF